jgi:hypothetical protein
MEQSAPTPASSRFQDAIRRARRWPLEEWIALARAAALVSRIEVGLRTSSLAGLGRRLGVSFDEAAGARTKPPAVAQTAFSDKERRQLSAISRVLRFWPFGDTCLRQCLASGAVLRSRGPRLVIGVARNGSEVTAHSWLVFRGGALDPLANPVHEPLARVADQSTRLP